MIDKNPELEKFTRYHTQFHGAGIKKYGKTYKQRSHASLKSAFFKMVDRLSVVTSIEVGAFQAEFSVEFKSESPDRYALAVEANPYNFAKFKDALNDAGVIYHHAAIQDREGPCELQLHVKDIDIENGYIRGNNSLLSSDARPDTRALSVPGSTLDTVVNHYVQSGSMPAPATAHPVLWIDVEGALDRVIKGGTDTISNSLVLFAEVETERLWNNQATFPEIAAQLKLLGFSPWLRDCEYEPEQFNVMFTNDKLVNPEILGELAQQFYDELQPSG